MPFFKAIFLDWGDTLMKDFPQYDGPMWTWPQLEAVAGVEKALREITECYPCYVVTNAASSGARDVYRALQQVHIAAYIAEVFTSRELQAQKPDPELYRRAARSAGISPEEAVMVGNDLKKDIEPAKKVGMSTILYDSGKASDNPSGSADGIIHSMADLLPCIVMMDRKRQGK